MNAPAKVDVRAVLGREHCLGTARDGLSPFACKCGRWGLNSLPAKGKAGSTTLRARVLRVSALFERHIRDERESLEAQAVRHG